ncbi:MAG: lyase family protein [Candidatus Caldarchaeum sp.]|nr:lyase family protein [Candidatus Caldarchaeales archaeon]
MTPLDGRYREKLEECSRFFSEYALIRYRLVVEACYLRAFLIAIGKVSEAHAVEGLEKEVSELSVKEAVEVKNIERRVGHDVVAVTMFLEKKLEERGYAALKPFIHFGLTSEDINNIAYGMALHDFIQTILTPALTNLVKEITALAETHAATPYLARTHGQPAVPTTFGSFLANYGYRLAKLTTKLKNLKPQAKLGGAVGDLSAHKTAYPQVDWISFAEKFVEQMGLECTSAATQVVPHERFSEILQTVAVIASVLANLCRDFWLLGALGLVEFSKPFEQRHSSTMPQKHNPLLYENAEGCFDLAAEMLSYMATRLLSSRLHRDLSDSVIKRFYGTAFALTLLGVKNLIQALGQTHVKADKMREEVEKTPEASAEILQLILRKHGVEDGYSLAAQAAEKGLDWLRETLSARGLDSSIVDEAAVARYVEAGFEKAVMLVERIRELVRGLNV